MVWYNLIRKVNHSLVKGAIAMTKDGKYTTKINQTTLTVPGGRVGKFNLIYTYIHQEEDLSRVNYYTPENEREDKRIYFEFKGYQFEAPAWQLSRKSARTNEKILKGLEENNLEHYVMVSTKINGKSQTGVVMLTAEEYQAIKDWFESASLIKSKTEYVRRTVSVKEKYANEIAKAKETGHEVIVGRFARDSNCSESDTEIVTIYIDSEGNITQNSELMN